MLLPFVEKLPLSAQRTLSILPIKVAPAARYSADASTEWRLRMWEVLWPEVSKHFWVGKGYTANATDYYLAVESQRRGLAQEYELALIAGDYHSGPLSLMIPFGFPGVLAFVLFLVAAGRVLYLNFRHGPAPLKTINTFLFASFMVRTFFFLALFGAVHSDILILVGLVGFSISVNGGVCQPTGKTAMRPAAAGTP
jgi:O-antigen ligase